MPGRVHVTAAIDADVYRGQMYRQAYRNLAAQYWWKLLKYTKSVKGIHWQDRAAQLVIVYLRIIWNVFLIPYIQNFTKLKLREEGKRIESVFEREFEEVVFLTVIADNY